MLPATDNGPGGSWALAPSTLDVLGSGAAAGADLPPYLQLRQQQEEQQREAAFQHWPAAAAAAAAAGGAESDAIQEADDGGCCAASAVSWQMVTPWECSHAGTLLESEECAVCAHVAAADWEALECDCGPSLEPAGGVPLPLHVLITRQAEPVAGIGVAFDDDTECSTWQAGGALAQHQQHQQQRVVSAAARQARLSYLWEGPGGGGEEEAADPWLALEDGGGAPTAPAHHHQQHQHQPPAAAGGRVPTFAARRQPLALGQSRAGAAGGFAQMGEDADEEEDVWDEGMLEQVCGCMRNAGASSPVQLCAALCSSMPGTLHRRSAACWSAGW